VLGDITRQSKGICIAGTHGKTTTSTITAHLLYQSQVSCNAFLGGIANNYNTNLLLSAESNLVVIEADEYDRSFHHLSPYMAVITSVDPDHMDIYKTVKAYHESFEYFTSLIRPGGALIIRKGIDIVPQLQKGVKLYTYSMNEGGDFCAENILTVKGEIHFDFVTPNDRINNVRLGVPVQINVENSVAAMALAWLNGVSTEELRTGISSYSGIYRRFNVVYKSEKIVFMDDYAHHPSELRASISSIRNLYPERKITGIFQPHLYSRTRDFAPAFAEALSQLDELILLDIYPAREEPIKGVDSELIFRDVKLENKILCSKENLLPLLKEKQLDVLVTFGAGDIDKLVPLIKDQLKKINN
jgi:UDP-N-acetylmuramate--alanine ligase